MAKLYLLFLFLIFADCASVYKIHSKTAGDLTNFTISEIGILYDKPYLYKVNMLSSKMDTTKSEQCIKNSIDKIKRKFGEFNILAKESNAQISDTVFKQINCFMSSLYHAEDIKTITVGDSLGQFLKSNFKEKFVLVFFQNGVNRSKANYTIKNIPYYLLSILTLNFYSIRISNSISRMFMVIIDNETQRPIYFGYNVRLCEPEDEITTNKHFEELIQNFIDKNKLSVHLAK